MYLISKIQHKTKNWEIIEKSKVDRYIRSMPNLEPYTLYEITISSLTLTLKDGKQYEFPETLANGRSNYILFEELIRAVTGLKKTSGSDHVGPGGHTYEQKAFKDAELFPGSGDDLFQTSASSTFGANNKGPVIKRLLEAQDYETALEICCETGYDKNDFYIYTNTKSFKPIIPMKYFVVPTQDVLANLSPSDPRLISRKSLMGKITNRVEV